MKFSYRITSFDDITPRNAHRKELVLQADVVPTDKRGTLEEKSVTTKIEFKVILQSSRLYFWKKANSALEEGESMSKVLYEFGREHLKQKLQEGKVTEPIDLILNNKNTRLSCPYDPAEIEIDLSIWHEVEVYRPIGFGLNF